MNFLFWNHTFFDGEDVFNDVKEGRTADWQNISGLIFEHIFQMGSVLCVLVLGKSEGFAVHKFPGAKGRFKISHTSPRKVDAR